MTKKLIDIDDKQWRKVKSYAALFGIKLNEALNKIINESPLLERFDNDE